MDWVRGAAIGQGSSAAVYVAFHRSFPSAAFAVKSTSLTSSTLLQREEVVLKDLKGCPQIIRCFGHDITTDISGELMYNLFLEYAVGGCIFGALPYRNQPSAAMFVPSSWIADFGLATRTGDESTKGYIKGTPLYVAPESASRNEYNTAVDIWALGCSVSEMASGRLPWRDVEDSDYGIWPLLFRIGCSDELPEIPQEMSEEGKDFLRCCFQKDPNKRWTAEMLLTHPFATTSSSEFESKAEAMSCSVLHPKPKSQFGYSLANSVIPLTPPRTLKQLDSFSILDAVREMMRGLATEKRPDWANTLPEEEEEGWLTVREKGSSGRIHEEIVLPKESVFFV
ncbi:mitogen-activated protein kinase kinase kinase YODA-like [Phalaenopsis equestris]|uniref:mitogen-activated protein kinase kinase kinase YODA-like n=1 Tax=Phalaenopsis equestris TaxID=78828 RepID=UPI0009E5DA58|nr:mitogen-activated protein kinase kinase kinase YODA-like [Phalaenopsis equestris]